MARGFRWAGVGRAARLIGRVALARRRAGVARGTAGRGGVRNGALKEGLKHAGGGRPRLDGPRGASRKRRWGAGTRSPGLLQGCGQPAQGLGVVAGAKRRCE